MMEIKRRQFLGWMVAIPALSLSNLSLADTRSNDAQAPLLFASASEVGKGEYYLHLLTETGEEKLRHRLPDRAHQVISHPRKPWLFAIARRPGTFIEVMDYQAGTLIKRITCETGYHLYGHAQITKDGRYLLTSEKSPTSLQGRIVVRDLHDQFRIIGEYSTGGIGPHEFRLTDDQSTLVVANGGILTDGRDKLNVETMQPSLAYIALKSGLLEEQVSLPEKYHQCGIRHIDISAQGDVIIAMQYEGHIADQVPLIAHHKHGQPITALDIPLDIVGRMKQYCGSACIDSSGQFAAVSAPKGDMITLWNLQAKQYIGHIIAKDGCGLARTQQTGEFVVSTGAGKLYTIQSQTLSRHAVNLSDALWDNHLTLI